MSDSDEEHNCNVCGRGVRYGDRHHACGSAVMALEARVAQLEAALLAKSNANEAALNTLCQVFHNGEEMEGDDGMIMAVDMALWHEGCDALDDLVGEDELEPKP